MTRIPRLLAVDDDLVWLEQLPLILEEICQVDGFETIDKGLEAVCASFYDIVLLDLNFPEDSRNGMDVFRRIHAADRGADVIVVSGETNHRKLIEIFNAGVTKFVPKPASPDEIRKVVQQTLSERALRLRALQQSDTVNISGTEEALIGSSPAMHKLRSEIERIVTSQAKDVLVIGETGTGKELVARMLAQESDPSGRFIVVHAGAISDGIAESELFGHVKGAFTGADRDKVGAFEAAGGGFVFLDEIGEMPLSQQAKLLRVLQTRSVQRVGSYEEKRVNFRTVSATNVDIERAIVAKNFREDLYFRIAREKIILTPLRERPEDIPELVHYFLAKAKPRQRKEITQDALALLQAYSWPGNVRQLRATIESLESRCDGGVIREKDICQALPEVANMLSSKLTKSVVGKYGYTLISNERSRFQKALIQANGDRTKAAQILGLSRATFFRRAKDLGLVRDRSERNLDYV